MSDNFTDVVPPNNGRVEGNDFHVPAGHTLQFTSMGMPYLKRDEDVAPTEEDDEAANEHKVEKLSFFVSMDEIERRYGIGTRLYFNFLKYIMITNAILSVLSSVPYFYFLSNKEGPLTQNDAFISGYSRDEWGLWLGINILQIVMWFTFGPVYFLYIKKRLENAKVQDHDNIYNLTGMALDEIKDNVHFTSTQRFWRRVGSYFIFILLIGVSGGITYLIQWLGRETAGEIFSVVNYVVTFSVVTINFFFQTISVKLVQLEKHKTWSLFRKHHTIKLIAFKIINVCAMYAALSFSFQRNGRCIYFDAGSKFVSLILIDLFFQNFMEMAVPLMKRWGATHVKYLQTKGGDEAAKPEFDVSQEYLELFYRQFVIYLGLSIFPGITVLGLITNILEYPLDKYRMLRICQRPKPLDISMKRFLVIWLFVTGLAGLLTWPQGAIWTLTATRGYSPSFTCCNLLPGTPDMDVFLENNNCTIVE